MHTRARKQAEVTADAARALGIDVGGTKVRASLVDSAGSIEAHTEEAVETTRAGFTSQLLRIIGEHKTPETVGIGIGIPGRVDPHGGEILSAGYLDIAGLDLAAAVGAQHGLPVRVENDATMALFAEAALRPDCKGVLAMVTVGTGIGGAVMAGGAPWYGGGASGQFGHIMVASDGPLCNCGRRGCVETLSSGTALARCATEAGLEPDIQATLLLAEARNGNDTCRIVVERWAAPFRRALQSIVAAFDPDLVVIGGGLGAAMVDALRLLPSEGIWFSHPVEAARLGDDAGAVGAGLRGFTAARA